MKNWITLAISLVSAALLGSIGQLALTGNQSMIAFLAVIGFAASASLVFYTALRSTAED